MKLIFFDETKNSDDYPHYHIGGVCIDEEHLRPIEEKISAVAENAFGNADLVRGTELHAAEIYHRKNHFKNWSDFGARIALIDEVMQILSAPEVMLIDVQINARKLWDTQSPEEVAFMFFCERSNDLCRAHDSLGMLIGDRESDRVAEKYATSLSGYRATGTNFEYGRNIENLVDSVHFTHSHLSRFLQLADIYTWLLQFCNRNGRSMNDKHQAILKIWARPDIDLGPSKYKEWPR
jgi:hypothetical protein